MVSEANTPENRLAAYRVLMKHAEKVAERQYALQLAAHLKKGRKKSTFKWVPTPVLIKLQNMAAHVVGSRMTKPSITPSQVMSYIAHDYDFQKERFG